MIDRSQFPNEVLVYNIHEWLATGNEHSFDYCSLIGLFDVLLDRLGLSWREVYCPDTIEILVGYENRDVANSIDLEEFNLSFSRGPAVRSRDSRLRTSECGHAIQGGPHLLTRSRGWIGAERVSDNTDYSGHEDRMLRTAGRTWIYTPRSAGERLWPLSLVSRCLTNPLLICYALSSFRLYHALY